MKLNRRFIAGAVCPECKETDKVVAFHNDDGEMVRECVRCHFSETMPDEGLTRPEEPVTRVNKRNRLQDTPEEPLAIFDPALLRKDH